MVAPAQRPNWQRVAHLSGHPPAQLAQPDRPCGHPRHQRRHR